MDIISEIHLRFLKNLILVLFILLSACSAPKKNDLRFYHPQRGIHNRVIPIIAQNSNGNVLEEEVEFDFNGTKRTELFRFRVSYFEILPKDAQLTISESEEITISSVEDTLLLSENKIYHLNHPLIIDSNAVMIMENGSQLYIDDAIDIINYGSIVVNGLKENPVLINALQNNWGGIRSHGGKLSFNHCIITHAGGNDSIKVRHSFSQPAIHMDDNGHFEASHLYIINCLGKAMYLSKSDIKINKALFADCDTGPEMNYSHIQCDSIICMNIPDSKNGEDDDNDALYIYGQNTKEPHQLSHLMLGFAKDDGFDHGKTGIEIENLLVYKVKDKAISLEGGNIKISKSWLSDARVLIGVKQDTKAVIDSIYLSGDGIRTDIQDHMQQNPTLEVSNEFKLKNKEKEAEKFWFSIL